MDGQVASGAKVRRRFADGRAAGGIAYLGQALLLMLLTLFGMSMLIFVLLRLVPGNIADILFDAAGIIDPGRQGEDREGARPRSADRRAVCPAGSAGCCTAISAIPTSPRSRRCRRSLPRMPITAKLAGDGAAVLGADRRAARRDQRGAAEHAARLCAARHQPQRAVAAVVLARAADPDGVACRCSA